MKSIFVLTCYDTKLKGFTARQHYSNGKSAIKSFDNLSEHIIKKHNLVNPTVKVWTFNTGGANKSHVINDRFNITLVKDSISKDVSIFS